MTLLALGGISYRCARFESSYFRFPSKLLCPEMRIILRIREQLLIDLLCKFPIKKPILVRHNPQSAESFAGICNRIDKI